MVCFLQIIIHVLYIDRNQNDLQHSENGEGQAMTSKLHIVENNRLNIGFLWFSVFSWDEGFLWFSVFSWDEGFLWFSVFSWDEVTHRETRDMILND